jgi:hypothetical protein
MVGLEGNEIECDMEGFRVSLMPLSEFGTGYYGNFVDNLELAQYQQIMSCRLLSMLWVSLATGWSGS